VQLKYKKENEQNNGGRCCEWLTFLVQALDGRVAHVPVRTLYLLRPEREQAGGALVPDCDSTLPGGVDVVAMQLDLRRVVDLDCLKRNRKIGTAERVSRTTGP